MVVNVGILADVDELLERVGLVAHRYVEGAASYKALVAAVKEYADECGILITPASREPVLQRQVKSKPAYVAPNKVEVLEPALEKRIARIRAELGKSDNVQKVKKHCDALFIDYTYVNVQRWRMAMRDMLRARREAKMQAGKDART